jgi:predicted cupin superfamily sugar epimerase
MNNPNIDEIIQHFSMIPHPEGGFYKRTYQSNEKIKKEALPSGFTGDRFFSTAIYYLLPKGQNPNFTKSALMKLGTFI